MCVCVCAGGYGVCVCVCVCVCFFGSSRLELKATVVGPLPFRNCAPPFPCPCCCPAPPRVWVSGAYLSPGLSLPSFLSALHGTGSFPWCLHTISRLPYELEAVPVMRVVAERQRRLSLLLCLLLGALSASCGSSVDSAAQSENIWEPCGCVGRDPPSTMGGGQNPQLWTPLIPG